MPRAEATRRRVASSVDLVSNAVLLSGLDTDDLAHLLTKGRLPFATMPSILHEAAHWDTFATPVGFALATAFLRAWRRTQLSEHRDTYETAMDLTRYRVGHELLRPLSEGLALFCEFDLLPGDSPATSTPTLLAGLVFSERDTPEFETLTLGEIAKLTLSFARTKPLFRSRKENLLCQNFSVDNGGYLPGYHFVKNLKSYLVSRRRLFDLLDGDLFFYVVRAVIFGDMRLARLLIDPQLDFFFSDDPEACRRDTVNAVLLRFQELLEFLVHDMDAAYVNRVADLVASRSWQWTDLPDPVSGEPCSQDDVDLVMAEMNKLGDEGCPGSAKTRAAEMCRGFIENRGLLCLAGLAVHVRVNSRGRCLVFAESPTEGTYPMLALEALAGIPPCDTAGTYEFYLDRSANQMLFSVAADGKCVACGNVNRDAAFDQAAFAARRPSMLTAAALCAKLDADLEAVAGDYPTTEHYLEQINTVCSQLYLRYCQSFAGLVGGNADALPDANLMRLAVAGGDLPLLADFAAVSLVGGGLLIPDLLEVACAELALSPTEFRTRLESWKARTGVALHENHGELLALLF